MGKRIQSTFNLFQHGRKYSGVQRNYILESAQKASLSPAVQERIELREAYGYLGHGRRQFARRMQLREFEPIKLPDGSTIIVENIPACVTVDLKVEDNGDINFTQEILDTDQGKAVTALFESKVGGWSWACDGKDGGALGATTVTDFFGFDYVLQPGYPSNRGILESAGGASKEAILESICEQGLDAERADELVQQWVASTFLHNEELLNRLENAAIYEDALRQDVARQLGEIGELSETLEKFENAEKLRTRLLKRAAEKSVIAVPDEILEAVISPKSEEDLQKVVGYFEGVSHVDRMLPVTPLSDWGNNCQATQMPRHEDRRRGEYGDVSTAPKFDL